MFQRDRSFKRIKQSEEDYHDLGRTYLHRIQDYESEVFIHCYSTSSSSISDACLDKIL